MEPETKLQPERKEETPQERYERQKREFFDSCTTERNRFITSKTEQSKTYDQTILTFSAGAIALSLTFVEKIAPVPVYPWLLYLAWAGFGIAILSVVVSFVLSQKAFQNEIDWVDASWAAVRDGKPELPEQRPNRYTKLTEWLNLASGLLFVGAFLFLVLFGGKNWPPPKKEDTAKAKPIKIEITGEFAPETTTMTVAPGSGTITLATTPTRPLLPPKPQPPPETTTGTTSTAGAVPTQTTSTVKSTTD